MSNSRRGSHGLARAVRVAVAGAVASATVLAGPMLATAHAAGVGGVVISEVAPWGSSAPYGADWFEVTNTGSVAVNVSNWKMDDNSNAFGSSVAMAGITSIAPGESVIFLETTNVAAAPGVIASFKTFWFGSSVPAGLQFGSYSGSGVGLSASGDAVNLYDSSGAQQANVSFGTSPGSAPFASFDNAAGANNTSVSTLSLVGVNGAFLVPTPAAQAAIGSPGTITSPGAPLPALARTGLPLLVGVAMLGGFVVLNGRRRGRTHSSR